MSARASQPALRAVFLSDLHLGSKYCHAHELASFLEELRCARLYLVGDILDLWWLTARRAVWGPAQQRVVDALHRKAREGTEIIYIPGNHDRPLRNLCGAMLPSMTVRRRAIHTLRDGRRLLVTHGDEYDEQTHFGNLQEKVGDWVYYVILTGNRWNSAVRRRLGLRYWSLADFLKRKSKASEAFIARFVHAGLADVRRRGLDGIVCGHIHRADLREVGGLIYANDGDWVENLTAVVETAFGDLQLRSLSTNALAEVATRCTAPAIAQAA